MVSIYTYILVIFRGLHLHTRETRVSWTVAQFSATDVSKRYTRISLASGSLRCFFEED